MDLQNKGRAEKILKEEGSNIRESAGNLMLTLDSPRKTLFAIAKLFNVRQRYFGKVGEFFSVRELVGINIVDALDDKLIIAIADLIKRYRTRCEEEPELARPLNPQAVELVKPAVKKSLKPLPEYPVAYIMLYTLQLAFEAFDPIIYNPPYGLNEAELETAFLEEVEAITQCYLDDRKTKLGLHLCDVAREYSVVTRLKCKCEDGEFEVAKQSLNMDVHGKPYDKLEIRCKSCGDERSLDFELPNFTDLSVKN